jgi:prevent-host-death family protein
MRRIAKANARMRFAQIVNEASTAGERVKITHYGKTIAVLISKEDLQRLQDCDEAREAKRRKSAGTDAKSSVRASRTASGRK